MTTKPEQQPCKECGEREWHDAAINCTFIDRSYDGITSPVLPSERITQPVGSQQRCGVLLNGKVRCVLASYHTGVGSGHEYDPIEVRAAFPKWTEEFVQKVCNGPAQPSVTATSGGEGATELKGCPFCGGIAVASDEFNEDGYWSTFCKSCKGMTAWFANKTASIIAWNRREGIHQPSRLTDAEKAEVAAIKKRWCPHATDGVGVSDGEIDIRRLLQLVRKGKE